MKKIYELMKELPFDEINLVDYKDGRFGIDIISDNGHNDGNSSIDMITLNVTKDNTTEIDNLIEILQIYKSKIKNN
jgi:hypothetical protein